jgi:hypothetical protein
VKSMKSLGTLLSRPSQSFSQFWFESFSKSSICSGLELDLLDRIKSFGAIRPSP